MSKSYLLAQSNIEKVFTQAQAGESSAIAVCKYGEIFLTRYNSDIEAFLDYYKYRSNIKEVILFIRDLLVIKDHIKNIQLYTHEDYEDIKKIFAHVDEIKVRQGKDIEAYILCDDGVYRKNFSLDVPSQSEGISAELNAHTVLTSGHNATESQFLAYSAGKDGRAGHGFAAEDANALHDKIKGRCVEKTGSSNIKNGADRIVDGQAIQTKYYATPQGTMDSFFEKGSHKIKYENQLLEVPADQYDAIVTKLKKAAEQGEVFDVSGKPLTPKQASKLVKKGSVTYNQAKNIARAGNLDSLWYDAKQQAVVSVQAFAISSAIHFARQMWKGEKTLQAIRIAGIEGLKSTGTGFIIGIASSQVLRTGMNKTLLIATKLSLKSASKTALGKGFMHGLAKASGKNLSDVAARNYAAKFINSSIITGAVTLVVMTLPDFYKVAISGNISWQQFTKNLVNNTAGIAGGTVGAIAMGAAMGSFFPGIGTAVGGFVGMGVGAFAASSAANKITNAMCKDDAEKMKEILNICMTEMAEDYVLSPSEIEKYITIVQKIVSPKFLMNMYNTGAKTPQEQAQYAKKYLKVICIYIISERPKVSLPTQITIRRAMKLEAYKNTVINLSFITLVSCLLYTIFN